MKLNQLTATLCLTICAFSGYAQNNEELVTGSLLNGHSIVTPEYKHISGDIKQYLLDNGLTADSLLDNNELADASKEQLSAAPPSWTDYISFNMTAMQFINRTTECRWAIMVVYASTGYSQVFHHRAEPFVSFGYPPGPSIGKKGGWVTKEALTTLPCTDTPPGIPY